MNHLETYLDRIIDQTSTKKQDYDSLLSPPSATPVDAMPVIVEAEEPGVDEATVDILGALKRRWYIILLVFILLAPVAVFGVWYFVQPGHIVVARLKVAPAVLDIMTGNQESGSIGNYGEFVATQALTITSSEVVQEVLDDLADEDLAFFREGPSDIQKKIERLLGKESQPQDRLEVLRRAATSGIISASPRRNTHFVDVSMKSMNPDEAMKIVDAFVGNYRDLYGLNTGREADATLETLEDEQKLVRIRIDKAKAEIRQLAEKNGASDVGSGREMFAARLDTILERCIELESKRIALETQVKILDQPLDSNSIVLEGRMGARASFINADARVGELTRQIMAMESQLLIAREQLASINPVLREKEKFLAALQGQLETRVETRGREYDAFIEEQAGRLQRDKIAAIVTELNSIKEEEKRFNELYAAVELKSITQDNAFFEIKDKQFEVDLDMEIYDTLSRRIKQMEMDKNQKPRITIVEYANRERYEDKRVTYAAGMAMGVFGLGCLLALLVDRADKRLKEPEDVASLTNLPLIGTVANARTVKAAKFAEQIASDYQTIRTNLTLLGASGMPKLLCITSPGPREGKSSFSVNLATSLCKSGERVLLIDGDMRKPDTLRKMNFAHMTEQVSHVPIEGEFEYSIWNVETTGLDILVPDAGNRADVYELIASPVMAHRIINISQKYDRIIIDTPPVLAFPDALIWARIAGSVIMISFAGKTTINDLIEAKDRLGQTNAQLLGSVLNNVRVSHGYQRYHYGYYYHKGGRRDIRMNKKLLMAAREGQKNKIAKPAKEKTA